MSSRPSIARAGIRTQDMRLSGERLWLCVPESRSAASGMTRSRSGFRQHLLPHRLAATVVREHEIRDARRDLGAEARAVEHAIVSDARLQIVHLVLVGDIRAQAMRGLRLTDAGNVVELALDREQRDAADFREIDRLAPMRHAAKRQC